MQKLIPVCKVLMAIFLLICAGVHIRGMASPFSAEPLWSHIVHTISYLLCLLCVVRSWPISWLGYTIGAIYPFLYHARCAWEQFAVYGRYSPICLLVVVVMPAGLALVWRMGKD